MAQAILKSTDTVIDRNWRDKERIWHQQRVAWRAKELEFRKEEILLRQEEREFMEAQLRWREVDVKQRRVNNSRYSWIRFSERNRRDVEEKSEHLRSISWLSGLVTSYTFTNPVEFNPPDWYVAPARWTAYAIFAAVVPTLTVISTIISIYLMGRILKMGKLFVAEDAEEDYMKQCRQFAESNETLQAPPVPRRTFERFWSIRCENDWEKAFSLFSWGIGTFLALLCSMSFIKFAMSGGLGIAIGFSSVIGIFFIIWVRTQLKWGAYLRKPPQGSLSLANIHRPQEALVVEENPIQSRVQLESRSCKFDRGTSSHHSIDVNTV